MKKIKTATKTLLVKYGHLIAACAFAFVAISANSSCGMPYYETEEPTGIDRFKRFNK